MDPKKILIVDDEYSFAEFAKMLLEIDGYRTMVCLEGRRALEAAASEKPDLILMDMNLQDINGIDVIRRLKADAATADIPVLLCSITKKRSEVQDALNCGAVDFLPKPLNPEEFRRQVRQALAVR